MTALNDAERAAANDGATRQQPGAPRARGAADD